MGGPGAKVPKAQTGKKEEVNPALEQFKLEAGIDKIVQENIDRWTNSGQS